MKPSSPTFTLSKPKSRNERYRIKLSVKRPNGHDSTYDHPDASAAVQKAVDDFFEVSMTNKPIAVRMPKKRRLELAEEVITAMTVNGLNRDESVAYFAKFLFEVLKEERGL